jgi:hypothetical protein
VQRLAAGHQHLQVRRGAEQVTQRGRCRGHVLEVVEEQQQPLIADVLAQAVPALEHAFGFTEHELWVTQRGKREPPDSVWVVLGECGC